MAITKYDAAGQMFKCYSPGIPLRRSDGGPWLDTSGNPMPGSTGTPPLTLTEVAREVDAEAQKYMGQTGSSNYRDALHAVLAKNRALAASYVGIPEPEAMTETIDTALVRDTVDAAVQAYQAEYPGTNYSAAMTAVFAMSPTLKAKYAAS